MILQRYKIVFGGTMGAGKSAAIQALSDIPVLSTEALNTDQSVSDKAWTTVGIDYGEIKLEDDLIIGLYGTPGQDRFDFMWDIICQGTMGIVLLIDHSRAERLQDLEFYLNAFKGYSANIVIGVSHVDVSDDQMLKIYRDWLNLHDFNCALFQIDAREKDDVLLMLEALLATAEINMLMLS
jgi:uncharacterized protein